MREEIQVLKNTKVIYTKIENNRYRIEVEHEGNTVYNNAVYERDYRIYKEFIIERLKVLFEECGKLHKPYVMIEKGNRMYRMADLDYRESHHSLIRQVVPCDYIVEEPYSLDLLIGSTLFDYFTYEAHSLVYKFGNFYLNGLLIHQGVPKEFKNLDLVFDFRENHKEYFEKITGMEIKSYNSEHMNAYYE